MISTFDQKITQQSVPVKAKQTLRDLFPYLYDPKVGVIRQTGKYQSPAGLPRFHHYYAKLGDTRTFSEQPAVSVSKGVAITMERAFNKGIGEAIERYCSAIYQKEKLTSSSYETMKSAGLNPNDFPQPILKSHTAPKNVLIRWVLGEDLFTQEKKYIPAAHVYFPYYPSAEEKILTQNITTGLACHLTPTQATITAICEVLERDAFMKHWYYHYSPAKLAINSLPQYLQKIINDYRKAHFEVTLFDISGEIAVPCILALLTSDIPNIPALTVAGACKLSAEQAVLSALEELEMTREFSQISWQKSQFKLITQPEQVKTQQDHTLFWCNPSNRKYADFLLNSTTTKSLQELPSYSNSSEQEQLEQLKTILQRNNLNTYRVDITSPDIAPLGLSVIRAVIPRAYPLTFGYQNIAIPTETSLGDPLNLIPHPFP